ncbi:hypothetical protein LGH82_24970 [Mesorhizobium sp. PAMC28654]|uniref:hypothetical protein n=1 Tax=Mesorhizobium sp. PAMC28654 TaxID=2880934 RepID=UPI001D0A6FAA|nr:hypothetical protein [Mesorhizobium sp. PAMC28654]UDL88361.1 hypothetical protein LGH82_24970 [Mesorhizobium sp. PAMC28654]
MRKVFWTSQVLTLALTLAAASTAPTQAQEQVYNLNQNENGFNLPGVTLPQGQDEVHAADGTTCRSAVSGSGAYLDLGVIRGNNQTDNGIATYGRVVIPIGSQPKRLDCSRLYELEVQRLEMELKLMKMGVSVDGATAVAAVPAAQSANWADQGWNNGKKKKKKK